MKNKGSIIRCPIHGSIAADDRELALINSPFFQRLRHISQLGFSSYVFPGAVHTRFSHSLGAMHLAGLVFDQLLKGQSPSLKEYYQADQLEYFKKIIRFSALLHDLGHPPFSHAAEDLLPDLSSVDQPDYLTEDKPRQSVHEDFSFAIIYSLARDEELLTFEEAYDIISVLSKEIAPSNRMNTRTGSPMIFPLLSQLISGEIDVDRMDYLLRDSYFAGVPYGKFDLDRLISSLTFCIESSLNQFLLALDGEAVPTYENFLLARVHMFSQIYFHKSLGAYIHYLRKAVQENEITFEIDGSLDNFLNLTESGLLEEFRKAKSNKWSGRIFNRIPAKNLIRVINNGKDKVSLLRKVNQVLLKNGIYTIMSNSSNQYSYQVRNQKINKNTILVVEEEFGQRNIIPIAERSTLLDSREKKIEIIQLYVLRENYHQAIKIINDHH